MRNLLSRKPTSAGAPASGLPVDSDGRPVLAEQPAAPFAVSSRTDPPRGRPMSPTRGSTSSYKSPQMIYNEHFSGLEVIFCFACFRFGLLLTSLY